MSAKRRLIQRRARDAITKNLPDLYAQLTPRKSRLTPKSSQYWVSGYPALVKQWHPPTVPASVTHTAESRA